MIQTYKFVPRLDTLVLATAGMHLPRSVGSGCLAKNVCPGDCIAVRSYRGTVAGRCPHCSFVKRLRSARFFSSWPHRLS